jgi:hypothetical protein
MQPSSDGILAEAGVFEKGELRRNSGNARIDIGSLKVTGILQKLTRFLIAATVPLE